MDFALDGKRAFAYSAAHVFDPRKATIAFLHGAGLDHSTFGLQSRYFGYHGRNVLALDLPGHGRSDGPPLPTIEGMADWLSKALKTANIGKASVVGHSMGALVALEFAVRHAAQCERIALIAPGYPMKVAEPFLEAARRNAY
jgi:pimeloyl-ACP methyl ester carboxylesterase